MKAIQIVGCALSFSLAGCAGLALDRRVGQSGTGEWPVERRVMGLREWGYSRAEVARDVGITREEVRFIERAERARLRAAKNPAVPEGFAMARTIKSGED
jgi:hypothetical protein